MANPRTYGALVTFLSRDILLFSLQDTFALQVCKLTTAGIEAAPILQTLCSLKLPGILSFQQVADLRLSQPSPLSGNHHPASPQRSRSRFPFRSDPEDDIIAFDVLFCDDQGRRVIFVARRRAILSLAIATLRATSMQPATRAWEEWGPRMMHWMDLGPLHDLISLAGSRFVKYSHLRDHFMLGLRDFNSYRVHARSAHDKTVTAAAGGGVAHQAVLSAEACFEEDVVSELPFVSIRKENVMSHVLLDDEWMAEILVRGLFFFRAFLPACDSMRAHNLCPAATDSGIKLRNRRSFSSVQSLHLRSCALDRLLLQIQVSCGLSFADELQLMCRGNRGPTIMEVSRCNILNDPTMPDANPWHRSGNPKYEPTRYICYS